MKSRCNVFVLLVDGSNQACTGSVLQGPQKIRPYSLASSRASAYKLERRSLCFRQRGYCFLPNRSWVFTCNTSEHFWGNSKPVRISHEGTLPIWSSTNLSRYCLNCQNDSNRWSWNLLKKGQWETANFSAAIVIKSFAIGIIVHGFKFCCSSYWFLQFVTFNKNSAVNYWRQLI